MRTRYRASHATLASPWHSSGQQICRTWPTVAELGVLLSRTLLARTQNCHPPSSTASLRAAGIPGEGDRGTCCKENKPSRNPTGHRSEVPARCNSCRAKHKETDPATREARPDLSARSSLCGLPHRGLPSPRTWRGRPACRLAHHLTSIAAKLLDDRSNGSFRPDLHAAPAWPAHSVFLSHFV